MDRTAAYSPTGAYEMYLESTQCVLDSLDLTDPPLPASSYTLLFKWCLEQLHDIRLSDC